MAPILCRLSMRGKRKGGKKKKKRNWVRNQKKKKERNQRKKKKRGNLSSPAKTWCRRAAIFAIVFVIFVQVSVFACLLFAHFLFFFFFCFFFFEKGGKRKRRKSGGDGGGGDSGKGSCFFTFFLLLKRFVVIDFSFEFFFNSLERKVKKEMEIELNGKKSRIKNQDWKKEMRDQKDQKKLKFQKKFNF